MYWNKAEIEFITKLKNEGREEPYITRKLADANLGPARSQDAVHGCLYRLIYDPRSGMRRRRPRDCNLDRAVELVLDHGYGMLYASIAADCSYRAVINRVAYLRRSGLITGKAPEWFDQEMKL